MDEARRIVETGVAIPTRDADSHDILGTYAIASNRREMCRRAATADEFLEILRSRHRVVMSGRPSCAPGLFKTRDNRAGNTHFVSFDYTLDEIPNDITRDTMASFEPTIDYVVIKIPRFTFEKFAGAKDELTTSMKSVN